MKKAVCISCGHVRGDVWRNCPACGFNPRQNEQSSLRSIYLSTSRFDDCARQRKYSDELDLISSQIQKGESVEFDPDEIQRLAREKSYVESVKTRHILFYLVKVFAPAIYFLVAMWLIYYIVLFLRQR